MIARFARLWLGLFGGLAGLLALGALLTACQTPSQPGLFISPPAAPAAATPQASGLTAATPAAASPAAAATGTSAQLTPVALGTPGANYATLTGVVIEASGRPPTEVVMFLGPLTGDPEKFPVVAVDRQTSPSAIPSPSSGRFVFADVPPGSYGVVYWTPDVSYLVKDPANPALSLIVKLGPGDVKDIGTLHAPPH